MCKNWYYVFKNMWSFKFTPLLLTYLRFLEFIVRHVKWPNIQFVGIVDDTMPQIRIKNSDTLHKNYNWYSPGPSLTSRRPPPPLKKIWFFLVFKLFYTWKVMLTVKKLVPECRFGPISAKNVVFLKKKWKNHVLATENT